MCYRVVSTCTPVVDRRKKLAASARMENLTRMPRLLSLLPLLALPALAAPGPSPMMKKAIGSAKEDDPPPPPKPALPPRAGPDVALLRGLMWAFEPAPSEIRQLAIEDLGLLGDARALNALAQIATDPNPALARAAIRAVALIRHPRAEEILSNVVRHPMLAEPTKLLALELLPYQNTDSAIHFMQQISRTTTFATSLQYAARNTLAEIPSGRGGTQ